MFSFCSRKIQCLNISNFLYQNQVEIQIYFNYIKSMEKNEIFKGIVTKITAIADEAGTPERRIFAKVYSEAEGIGVGIEFEIKSLNSIPTKPLGTKGVALPVEGQKVLLFRSPTGDLAYIIGYIDDTSVSIPTYERPIESGEYKIVTQGIRPTELSIKPNEVTLDSGGYSKMVISQRTSDINMQSKKYLRQFHGGYEENQWIKSSGITPSMGNWSKYKENNAASDKFNIETEEPRTPIIGVLPDYVDKVIERKGAILDYSDGGALLDHVYQLETRQDVGGTGVKNTFSVLRLGHQDKMAGDLPIRQGSIIDWSTKRVNSATSATTTVWKTGLATSGEIGEIFRSQFADGYVIRAIPGVDPAARDQGYELLDILTDNSDKIANYWYSESVNTGENGYFYRKGHGKTNFLHNYEESSENSFIKRKSSRKDDTVNEFLEEMKQDSYDLTLETEDTVYYVRMTGKSIEIKMRADDSDDTTSVITLNNEKAEVKFGKNSVITLTEGKCLIDTKDEINLDTKDTNIISSGNLLVETTGNTKIDTTGKTEVITTANMTIDTGANIDIITTGNMLVDTTGNLKIDTTGTTDLISTGLIKVDGNVTFEGGDATMLGTAPVTAGKGPFCGLPNCLFTGAPHIGSVAKN
jgi:hypothetical protein